MWMAAKLYPLKRVPKEHSFTQSTICKFLPVQHAFSSEILKQSDWMSVYSHSASASESLALAFSF